MGTGDLNAEVIASPHKSWSGGINGQGAQTADSENSVEHSFL